MLPLATQDRFIEAVPDYFDLRYNSDVRRYHVSKWWSNEDHEKEYPSVILQLSPSGTLRTEDQPIDGLFANKTVSDDSSVARERVEGSRLHDELTVTCLTRGMSDGVSARERGVVLARRMRRFLRHDVPDSSLTEPGSGHNEIPIHVPQATISGPVDQSGMVDDAAVRRYVLTARINYTIADGQTTDAVADWELEFHQTN